jgi:hypothetical protein
VALPEELEAAAAAAAPFAAGGERVAGVVPVEPDAARMYLVAYADGEEPSGWLVLDGGLEAVTDRQRVRDAASIAALVEYAEDVAAGGDLDDLRAQIVALRLTENPPGLDEAEQALDDLVAELGSPPRVATPERLDRVGAATRRLEAALGGDGGSPFAAAMKEAGDAVQAFVSDVEAAYKLPLGG